jgi:hypothetical protein
MIDNSENQLKTEVVIPEVSRTETSNEVFNLQKCIAKAEMPALKKGLSGLERYEVKVSRTVLRGGSDGNVTLLPGELKRSMWKVKSPCFHFGIEVFSKL